jgi:hypothetical protein
MTASESGISFSSEKLASLKHLNGVINEALRLYPVVPTGTYRKAPPEGIFIGGTFIPGGTDVWTPQYALGRSEDIYSEPNRFLPERWYKYPDWVKDPTAFAPFLTGISYYTPAFGRMVADMAYGRSVQLHRQAACSPKHPQHSLQNCLHVRSCFSSWRRRLDL